MDILERIEFVTESLKNGARAIVLPANGDPKLIEPTNGTDFKLEELQPIVDDGYCKHIEIVHMNHDWILVINEEGKFGDIVEVNELATAIALPYLFPGDFIAGNCLLCRDEMMQ